MMRGGEVRVSCGEGGGDGGSAGEGGVVSADVRYI